MVFIKKTFYDISPNNIKSMERTNDLENIYEDKDMDIPNSENTTTYFSSIYFQENKHPFWCVKSNIYFMEF